VDVAPHPADLTTPLPAISEWTYASFPQRWNEPESRASGPCFF
jgi:hypothetical protein